MILCVPSACSKKSAPTRPESELPPQVVAVSPPANSTGIWYDTVIWADFAEPLDSTTVDATTVFLKLDTQRLAASITYDGAARRVVVQPLVPLPLARTLTVEFGPALRTAAGGAFDQTYFWQFRTNGLRRIEPVGPEDGSPFESPSVGLLWTPTEPAAGTIDYQLYTGTDSAQVAARTVTARSTTRPYYLPFPRWPQGTRLYWSVRANNQTTGESYDGPVWSFATAPFGAEVDSISVPLTWWGSIFKRTGARSCNPASLASSNDFVTALRWGLDVVPRDTKVATARMYVASSTTTAASRFPTLTATTADMLFCDVQNPGPPFGDFGFPVVAAGVTTANPMQLHYESDFFTAHVQATIAHRQFYGYLVSSSGSMSYQDPRLTLIVYRVPPALAARAMAR